MINKLNSCIPDIWDRFRDCSSIPHGRGGIDVGVRSVWVALHAVLSQHTALLLHIRPEWARHMAFAHVRQPPSPWSHLGRKCGMIGSTSNVGSTPRRRRASLILATNPEYGTIATWEDYTRPHNKPIVPVVGHPCASLLCRRHRIDYRIRVEPYESRYSPSKARRRGIYVDAADVPRLRRLIKKYESED